jgi:hypothetical protein
MRIILLAVCFLSIFALSAPVTKSDDDDDHDHGVRTPSNNLIAAHDSRSPQYRRDCTSCHSNILTETSLTSIKSAHVAMLPSSPGESNNVKCRWCHRQVDLGQGTAPVGKSDGNLRKRVDTRLCAVCHSGPSSPGKQFYQTASPALTGAELYEVVCAACHGSLPNSEVRGESASEIQEEIDENEGGMGPLRVLSPQQIQAIANALAQ